LTGSVSWKNRTVAEAVWSLDENGTFVAGGFSQGIGALPSPQTIGFNRTVSSTANAFTVTAVLDDGAVQVGSVTSKSISPNCS
jgi:hypothetical protein